MIRKAYGVDKLQAQGLTGKGRTIAIVGFVIPPTLEKDLQEFSRVMKLSPPNLTVHRLTPDANPAPFDADNETSVATATETTLDVQMAYMMAPDARIVVTEVTSVPPSTSQQPDASIAEAISSSLTLTAQQENPDVISVSYAFPEYPAADGSSSPAVAFREASQAFAALSERGITLVAAAGDSGAAPAIGPRKTRVKTAYWPASDPHFLSIGGSQLHLDDSGKRTMPDTVWNDSATGQGATGGGPSQTFSRPPYQDHVLGAFGDRRGTPDLSMTSSPHSGAALVYQSYSPAGPGWIGVGGTSAAAPMFAGIAALADQKAGRRLGSLHEELYALAYTPHSGIVDITQGDNGPDGFSALAGYDLASGLGTVDASSLVPALARAVDGQR
ncbi:S8 family serine peptidase [Streptomyces sp. NPDC059985]|uniref:S53 family peptidase n=1 Tax=Streptomyces sp. NPDC059985 TaxID=3347025 RepID=UPI0036951927